MTDPTIEQICAYLHATGWDQRGFGDIGTLWVLNRPGHHANGRSLGVPHSEDGAYPPSEVIKRIAAAENRHPADVRDDILNPPDPRISRFVAADMCTRAAVVVRRQLDEASDDGWPGIWDHNAAWAMGEQAVALAEALDKTAAVIKTGTTQDPSAPLHLLCRAAWAAASAILRAEPVVPDDMDALRARLDTMRATKPASNGGAAKGGGNCGG